MESQLRREGPSSWAAPASRPYYEVTKTQGQNMARDYRANRRGQDADNIAFMQWYEKNKPTTLQRETDEDRRYYSLLAQGYGRGGRTRSKTRSKTRSRTRSRARSRTRSRTRNTRRT